MILDTTYYYRLTNNSLGAGANTALDVDGNGSGHLIMAPVRDVSGQYWKFFDLGDGKYAFRTKYLGDDLSLDVTNDGNYTIACLAKTGTYPGFLGTYPGQRWSVDIWPDGTRKLTNGETGPNQLLDTHLNVPFMGFGDNPGQHWTFTRLTKIPDYIPIPSLDPKGTVNDSEGPTDFNLYKKPLGTVNAVMIFVDFSNAGAGSTSATDVANHLLGNGDAQQLFSIQSYGKMSLNVVVKSDLGWKRMPLPSTSYIFDESDTSKNFDRHKKHITDAASLFNSSEVNFSDFDFVFVVAPENAGFPLSPAFIAYVGDGASSSTGEIRLAVTFGTDSYKNRYINLVHEVGHLFGLPDLYPYRSTLYPYSGIDSKVGCWGIMSDIFHSVSFLGWHRHKNGWIEKEIWLNLTRKTYIPESISPWFDTLSPLSSAYGLCMIVIPIDDPKSPSKVLVLELAQPVLGTNNKYSGEGVLMYTVDAKIDSGKSPLVVIPRKSSSSDDYGFLYEAPYQVGDVASFEEGNVSISVSVLQKFGSSYNIRIDYSR